jgi:hypothetical protein
MNKSNAERQKTYRDKRKQEGDFMLTVWLSKENSQKLDRLVKESGLTVQVARERIINQAVEKL